MDRKPYRVVVEKIDLDTIGAAWFLGVTAEDEIQAIRGNASAEDLANPDVICIEVGGSGQVEMNNFDHHGESFDDRLTVWSAAYQAMAFNLSDDDAKDIRRFRIAEYINMLDCEGTEAIRRLSSGNFPFLSDIVSGILLTKRNPVDQLLEGIRFLESLERAEVDPFGSMEAFLEIHPDFRVYAKAHEQNKLMIAQAIKETEWGETRSGLKMAWLETSFFGALGALYAHGAKLVVVFNPDFRGTKKFTIGRNDGLRVDSILSLLNAVEEGWGGPGSGTILGSPKSGSNMELDEVIRIVRDNL